MKIFKSCILIILWLGLNSLPAISQSKPIYNPDADAASDIADAIAKAGKQGKHVLIQIGGNWCPWCIRLHDYYSTNMEVSEYMNAHYVSILVNYSKENQNTEIMEQLEFPQRFGFPVLVILDQDGKRIHTQDTGLLESGGSYDHKKLMTFLSNWTADAINPDSYRTETP